MFFYKIRKIVSNITINILNYEGGGGGGGGIMRNMSCKSYTRGVKM